MCYVFLIRIYDIDLMRLYEVCLEVNRIMFSNCVKVVWSLLCGNLESELFYRKLLLYWVIIIIIIIVFKYFN